MRNFLRRHGAFVGGIILGAILCYLIVSPTMIQQAQRNRDLATALEERVTGSRQPSIASQLLNEGVASWPVETVEEIEVGR